MRITLKGMCFLQDIFNFENTCSFELEAIKATRNVSINSETFGYRVLGFFGGTDVVCFFDCLLVGFVPRF